MPGLEKDIQSLKRHIITKMEEAKNSPPPQSFDRIYAQTSKNIDLNNHDYDDRLDQKYGKTFSKLRDTISEKEEIERNKFEGLRKVVFIKIKFKFYLF